MSRTIQKPFIEQDIAVNIKDILDREVKRYKDADYLEKDEVMCLEKFARIYSILMADYRENIKQQVYSHLTTEELERMAADSTNDF